jgi:hypothetical protein
MFCIIMHQHSDFANPELVGEVAIVIGVAVCVDASLYCSNHIRVFGGDNRPEEYVRTISWREEDPFLGLQAKVQ